MQPCAAVWLKRDLRLADHEPLRSAIASKAPLFIFFIFEPTLLRDAHYSERHWRFVWQSLLDINAALKPYNLQVHVYFGEAVAVLANLHNQLHFSALYSHEEVGIAETFKRDQAVQQWAKSTKITWHESPSGAVQRGLKNRQNWDKHWQKQMRMAIKPTPLHLARGIKLMRRQAACPNKLANATPKIPSRRPNCSGCGVAKFLCWPRAKLCLSYLKAAIGQRKLLALISLLSMGQSIATSGLSALIRAMATPGLATIIAGPEFAPALALPLYTKV